MSLTKAIEAARILLTAVYQADRNEELAENITGAMMGNLDNALSALPDNPMTEDEIIEMACGAFCQRPNGESVNETMKFVIRALKSANVLFVKKD